MINKKKNNEEEPLLPKSKLLKLAVSRAYADKEYMVTTKGLKKIFELVNKFEKQYMQKELTFDEIIDIIKEELGIEPTRHNHDNMSELMSDNNT